MFIGKTILLAASLAATGVTAAVVRDAPAVQLAARQTDAPTTSSGEEDRLSDSDIKCLDTIAEYFEAIPTPPPTLTEGLGIGGHNPCSFEPPSSIASEYSSYILEALGWIDGVASAISSGCPPEYATMTETNILGVATDESCPAINAIIKGEKYEAVKEGEEDEDEDSGAAAGVKVAGMAVVAAVAGFVGFVAVL